MTIFYMVRHGEPDWEAHEDYKFKGHGRDLIGLTPKGIEQAKKIARNLKDIHADIIIASPYTRTMHTAAIISRELNLDIQVEVDLREWQPDLTYEYASYEEFNQLNEDYEKHQGIIPPNELKRWEPKKVLEDRVNKALNKYLDYDKVIVVAHEKVMMTQINDKNIAFCDVIKVEK